VEDKAPAGSTGEKTFSWWDVQDENARLPVKEAPSNKLAKFFAPPTEVVSTTDAAAKAAKGAFKSFGKAMNAVAGTEDTGNHGPPVSVMAFKVLDLMKMHDDFHTKHGGRRGVAPAPAPRAQPRAKAPAPAPVHQQQARAAGLRQQQQRQQSAQQQQQQQRPPQQQQQQAQTGSLLDFGAEEAPPVQSSGRHLNHTTSSPASFNNLHSVPAPAPANETRAEKLKREYAKKHSNSKKVWDEVDQRWVEVDYKSFNSSFGAGNGAKKKEIGISLDSANAAGKSQSVQAAVNKRVNDMRQSQVKALQEVREREENKKRQEDEEDAARKQLEPKIKAWSEEHGKKKQLRALLGTLHIILWPGANWKPMGLGDLLEDGKVKRAFHKASRVVHPDKTHHLPADQRFLAKRIFDALSQAKTEFDEGSK